jgi:hypothetical protein
MLKAFVWFLLSLVVAIITGNYLKSISSHYKNRRVKITRVYVNGKLKRTIKTYP